MLRAVLLDLDGTLVDRDAALRAWLRRRAGIGGGRGGELDRLLALDHADSSSLAALSVELLRLRPGLGADPRRLAERIREELPRHIPRDRAVLRALDRLADAGLRLALISNGGPSQRAKLRAAAIDPRRFDAMVISSELGRAKPDPAVFEAALRALALPAAATVMIGDCPRNDIAGAEALGIPSCWIARGRAYPPELPAPSLIAPELPAAVARLLDGSAQGKSKSRVSASRTSEE